jgi:hypothetical protein
VLVPLAETPVIVNHPGVVFRIERQCERGRREDMDRKGELVEKIVDFEWKMFQKVKNIGEKAPCQEDLKTFRIVRSSQFESWPEAVLESYSRDLEAADKEGRNLISEKYGRMMKSTSPDNYARIEHLLPPLDDDTLNLINRIAGIMLEWKEETVKKTPSAFVKDRPLYAALDNSASTSFETYLRGELSTYSKRTLQLYYEYLLNEKSQNRNLSKIIGDSIAKKYGYKSREEAEEALAKRETKTP